MYTVISWSSYSAGAISTSVVLRETNSTFRCYTMDNNVLHNVLLNVFLYTPSVW